MCAVVYTQRWVWSSNVACVREFRGHIHVIAAQSQYSTPCLELTHWSFIGLPPCPHYVHKRRRYVFFVLLDMFRVCSGAVVDAWHLSGFYFSLVRQLWCLPAAACANICAAWFRPARSAHFCARSGVHVFWGVLCPRSRDANHAFSIFACIVVGAFMRVARSVAQRLVAPSYGFVSLFVRWCLSPHVAVFVLVL